MHSVGRTKWSIRTSACVQSGTSTSQPAVCLGFSSFANFGNPFIMNLFTRVAENIPASLRALHDADPPLEGPNSLTINHHLAQDANQARHGDGGAARTQRRQPFAFEETDRGQSKGCLQLRTPQRTRCILRHPAPSVLGGMV